MIKKTVVTAIYSLPISLMIYSMMLDLLFMANEFLLRKGGGDYLGWLFIAVYGFIALGFYSNYELIAKCIFRNNLMKILSFIFAFLIIFIYTESGVVFKLLSIRNSSIYKHKVINRK